MNRSLFVAVVAIVSGITGVSNAQELVSFRNLDPSRFVSTPAVAPTAFETRHGESYDLYKYSRVGLWVGAAFDNATKIYAMTHKFTDTHISCDFGECHPVTVTEWFDETGWAGGIVGKRNTAGIVAANLGLTLVTDIVTHAMYKKGGRWRTVATTVNSSKGGANGYQGFVNLSRIRFAAEDVKR